MSDPQAVDADLGSNLTYRIRKEGSDRGVDQLFHINPVTGKLSVLKVLDYEALTVTTYTFIVEALDMNGTMPPGLASVTVTIVVSEARCVVVNLILMLILLHSPGLRQYCVTFGYSAVLFNKVCSKMKEDLYIFLHFSKKCIYF